MTFATQRVFVASTTVAFGQPLPACFGGAPGWLLNAVPPNTQFDFVEGRIVGLGFSLARTPSGNWIPTQ